MKVYPGNKWAETMPSGSSDRTSLYDRSVFLSSQFVCFHLSYFHIPYSRRMDGRKFGGVRQRLARERESGAQHAAASSAQPLKSSLASFLVYSFTWGLMSPQLVQKLAVRAAEDITELNRRNAARFGTNPSNLDCYEDLLLLGALGDEGRYSGNCNRDIMKT